MHPTMTVSMDSERATQHFAGDAASAAPARRFVAGALRAWGCPELEDTAVLLVGELMANVALHAAGGTDVVIALAPTRLRVEVHDGSRALPQRKHYSRTATTGRGLGLVEQLSATWGSAPTGSGKQVWFELDRFGPPPAATFDVDLDQWPDLDLPEVQSPPARPSSLRPRRPTTGRERDARSAHPARAGRQG